MFTVDYRRYKGRQAAQSVIEKPSFDVGPMSGESLNEEIFLSPFSSMSLSLSFTLCLSPLLSVSPSIFSFLLYLSLSSSRLRFHSTVVS